MMLKTNVFTSEIVKSKDFVYNVYFVCQSIELKLSKMIHTTIRYTFKAKNL